MSEESIILKFRKELTDYMQNTIELNKYLEAISRTKSPISDEDLKDLVEFYKIEFGMSLALRIYNDLTNDPEMKDMTSIIEQRCAYYSQKIFELVRQGVVK